MNDYQGSCVYYVNSNIWETVQDRYVTTEYRPRIGGRIWSINCWWPWVTFVGNYNVFTIWWYMCCGHSVTLISCVKMAEQIALIFWIGVYPRFTVHWVIMGLLLKNKGTFPCNLTTDSGLYCFWLCQTNGVVKPVQLSQVVDNIEHPT